MEPLALAVVGRPNVGKSTLVNRLLGYDRSLVDSRPGTTRDALQADFTWNGTVCRLTDTAGIRRKARVVDPVERYSVSRALRSVDAGDVVIHLLDGAEGVTDQDAQVMSYASQRGKGMVLGVNKWDLPGHGAGEPARIPEIFAPAPTVRRPRADRIFVGQWKGRA